MRIKKTIPQKLPRILKKGIETLSGLKIDNVKVHNNSSQPTQLQANAYTLGNAIHIAPGQEQNLPHEAWKVVQQKQGRVQTSIQMNRNPVNDNASLEKEADEMGTKALKKGMPT